MIAPEEPARPDTLLDRALAVLVDATDDDRSPHLGPRTDLLGAVNALALCSIAESLESLVAGPGSELGARFLADMALAENERAAPPPAARLARYLLAELDTLDDLLGGFVTGPHSEALAAWAGRVRINVRDELEAAEAG